MNERRASAAIATVVADRVRGLALFAGCAISGMLWAPPASSQASIANVYPVHVDFGTIKVGAIVSVPVTVHNLTDSPMTGAGGGFAEASPFYAGSGTCTGLIPANGSCQLEYRFRPRPGDGAPTSIGTTLTLTAGGISQSIAIQFVGRGTGSLVDIAPRRIDFGTWFIGQTVSVPVRVSNRNPTAVSFAGGGFGSANGFNASSGTCGVVPLAAGASCEFIYSFTPSQAAAVSNSTTLIVSNSSPPVSQSYALEFRGAGTAQVPLAAANAVEVDMGDVELGRETSFDFDVANQYGANLRYQLRGTVGDTSAFGASVLPPDACRVDRVIVLGQSCLFRYRFAPPALGTFGVDEQVQLYVGAGDPASQNIDLAISGTGVGTLARVWPVEFDFGELRRGTAASFTVTLLNTGRFALQNFLGGGVLPPFQSTTDCPVQLGVGQACQRHYTFNTAALPVGATYSAETLLAFSDQFNLIDRTVTLRMRGVAVDRVFNGGFESP